jgi:hypothetical protein
MVFNYIRKKVKGAFNDIAGQVGKAFQYVKDRGTTLLTDSNYCGPFNSLSPEYIANNPPRNKVDASCMAHDKDYENIARNRDTGKISQDEAKKLIRESDDRLLNNIDRFRGEAPYTSKVSELGIRGKKFLEDIGILNPNQFVGQ